MRSMCCCLQVQRNQQNCFIKFTPHRPNFRFLIKLGVLDLTHQTLSLSSSKQTETFSKRLISLNFKFTSYS
ncbi:hypothetical protein PRUPE_7G118100 [Prunus persica]|uniref:Uncharacterized protein n=1 Tax=Prunus persica TaxID=3760 RepID=A0A251NAC3_PRUPE|nr:hypothetical protein PRUPE_7G118100 [Prunus persica]